MSDFLLELRSEEIPARMQRRAAEDLRKLVTDALVERGFLYEGAAAYATPRRLALTVAGLPPRGQDVREERRGPRVPGVDLEPGGDLHVVDADLEPGADAYAVVVKLPHAVFGADGD